MFPNERPISQIDLIDAAESEMFSELSATLKEEGFSETYKDFDFTEVPHSNPSCSSSIIARPKPGVQHKVWGYSHSDPEWFEDIMIDAQGEMLNSSGQPVGGSQTPAVGSCPSCGQSTTLSGGGTGAFCPACGTQQPAHVPLIPGHQLGAALGIPAMPIVPPTIVGEPAAFDPNRMTGSPKPPVVIPEGLGRETGDDEFAAFLDEAIKAGDQ